MSTANLPQTADLPAETKRRLLALLVRDLLSTSPGPLSVTDGLGEVVVYTVPLDARDKAVQAIQCASPEELFEIERRASAAGDAISFDEALNLPFDPGSGPDQSR
jgi:hypothetical protein